MSRTVTRKLSAPEEHVPVRRQPCAGHYRDRDESSNRVETLRPATPPRHDRYTDGRYARHRNQALLFDGDCLRL